MQKLESEIPWLCSDCKRERGRELVFPQLPGTATACGTKWYHAMFMEAAGAGGGGECQAPKPARSRPLGKDNATRLKISGQDSRGPFLHRQNACP